MGVDEYCINCGSSLHEHNDCPFGDYLTTEQSFEIQSDTLSNKYTGLKIRKFLGGFLAEQESYYIRIDKEVFNLHHLIDMSENIPFKYTDEKQVVKLMDAMDVIMKVYHDELFDIAKLYKYAKDLSDGSSDDLSNYMELEFLDCPASIIYNGLDYDDPDYDNYVIYSKYPKGLIKSRFGQATADYFFSECDKIPKSLYKHARSYHEYSERETYLESVIEKDLKKLISEFWDKDTAEYLCD